MNVLEQLQALGFREEPYQFYDGGDAGDPSGGAGPGPGGTDVGAEISVDYGGTGPSVGDTVGQGAVSGPSGPYGGPQSIDNAQVAAAISPTVALATELATSPSQAYSLTIEALNDLGFGAVTGFNAANPTQSIAELQAAQNVAAAAPYALSFMPGMGLARGLQTGAQLAANLASGKLSPADVITDLGLTLASAFTGQSKGTLAAAARGDFGTAAMSAAKGAITSALAQHTGVPASIVGVGVNAVFSGIGSGVTSGTTGAPAGGGTDVAGLTGGGIDVASMTGGVADAAGPDVSGGTSGFSLDNLGPLFTVAALEDILTPKEKEEQEKERAIIASPFGSMPYA